MKRIDRSDINNTSILTQRYRYYIERYSDFLEFKQSLRIGDVFWLPTDEVGIERDCRLPEYEKFKIIKFYPHCIMMEHKHKTWKWTYTHKYCPDYHKLYQLYRAMGEKTDAEEDEIY